MGVENNFIFFQSKSENLLRLHDYFVSAYFLFWLGVYQRDVINFVDIQEANINMAILVQFSYHPNNIPNLKPLHT